MKQIDSRNSNQSVTAVRIRRACPFAEYTFPSIEIKITKIFGTCIHNANNLSNYGVT